MNILINLTLLSFIIVFIIDLSGFIDSLKYLIWKKFIKIGDYHNLQLKPLSCSLCSTFWVGIIYLIVTNNFGIPYLAVVCCLSLLSSNIADFERFLMDLFTYLIEIFYKLIK